MSEPSPRQVLYALVAAGCLALVAILVAGGAVAGLVPPWWSIVMAVGLLLIAIWSRLNWRRTAPVLLVSIGLLVIWMIGTLIVAI
ncbi:MAG: hypothetical protein ACRDWF_07390 [Acidimicrobiia bacterium]